MVVPLQVATALRERGYVAETWFLYEHEPAFENEPGIRVILPRRVRSLVDLVRIFMRLVSAMRAFRPDAVHGVLPLGNAFGLLAAAIIGCPSRVASQHTEARTHSTAMRWLDWLLGTIGVYTRNITVSHAVGRSYAGYPRPYVRRLRVVQNGMRTPKPQRSKAEARAHFGLPVEVQLLGNLGRLAHQKYQDFLFDVMAALPDVHLALAGDGPLREQYEAQIKAAGLTDRIHLLGAVPPEDVPDFLGALDLFVLPSRYEGLPIALIEAMQTGCPVIASDIPPTIEVAMPEGDEVSAVVLSLDSAEPWIEAVRDLFAHPEKLSALAEASRRRGAFFTLDRMADGYIDCLFPD